MRTVRYVNFWEGFDPSASHVGDWLTAAVGEHRVVPRVRMPVDIEVSSVKPFPSLVARAWAFAKARHNTHYSIQYREALSYGSPQYGGPSRRRIWYCGENIRVPMGYDLTLSCDIDDYAGSNVYAPFWLSRVDSGLTNRCAAPRAQLIGDDLVRCRRVDQERPHFCAVVISNPHPLRIRAISALSVLGKVDVFGRAMGRPIADKQELLSNYRFSLVFENDLYPGYVTEKPFDAWAAGTVPLWWGDDAAGYLNPDALVNLATLSSLAEFVELVADLERDVHARTRITQEPLLLRNYDHDPLIDRIRQLVD